MIGPRVEPYNGTRRELTYGRFAIHWSYKPEALSMPKPKLRLRRHVAAQQRQRKNSCSGGCRGKTKLLVAWTWDNHHHPGANLRISLAADITLPGHWFEHEYLSTPRTIVGPHLPLCSSQFSAELILKTYTDALPAQRSDVRRRVHGVPVRRVADAPAKRHPPTHSEQRGKHDYQRVRILRPASHGAAQGMGAPARQG